MIHPWFDDISFEDVLNKKIEPTYFPEIEDFKEDEQNLTKRFFFISLLNLRKI